MARYYRVSLGKGGVYAPEAVAQGWVGTGWMADLNLTGKFPAVWKEFNREYIPVIIASGEAANKIGAGLACGMTWTVARGLQEGDVVLSSNGKGQFFAGKVTGDYFFASGEKLPHRRPIVWFPELVDKASMSEELARSIGGYGTVQTLDDFGPEIEKLLAGNSPEIIVSDRDVENPVSFVLEKHLEDFLVSNWERTDLGKNYDIYEEDGEKVGQQFPSDTGPLDILAVSKDRKTLLVVELKRGRVSDVVVGQIQRYMGYVQEELCEAGQQVRGIIIGLDDDKRIQRALAVAPTIEFYRYEVSFKLTKG
jgi:restriction system protein